MLRHEASVARGFRDPLARTARSQNCRMPKCQFVLRQFRIAFGIAMAQIMDHNYKIASSRVKLRGLAVAQS